METVKIETKAFGRKTVYEEIKESNRELRESMDRLIKIVEDKLEKL